MLGPQSERRTSNPVPVAFPPKRNWIGRMPSASRYGSLKWHHHDHVEEVTSAKRNFAGAGTFHCRRRHQRGASSMIAGRRV
jgi:hypothetical protein